MSIYLNKYNFYINPKTNEFWSEHLKEWIPIKYCLYDQKYPTRNEGRLARTFVVNYYLDGSTKIGFSFTNKRSDITLRSTDV